MRTSQYAWPDFISEYNFTDMSVVCSFGVQVCVYEYCVVGVCVLNCLEHFQSSVCPRGLRGFRSGAVITGQGSFCPLHVPSAARCTVQKKTKNPHTQANIVMSWPASLAGSEGQGFRGRPICQETGSVFKQVTWQAEKSCYTLIAV